MKKKIFVLKEMSFEIPKEIDNTRDALSYALEQCLEKTNETPLNVNQDFSDRYEDMIELVLEDYPTVKEVLSDELDEKNSFGYLVFEIDEELKTILAND